jgi:hypothetical protein
MMILDKGHEYFLDTYDSDQYSRSPILTFMKRRGEGYPGNTSSYPGTNCQEVLRALIDRVKYLDGQIPCKENKQIVFHLRSALFLFEDRAAYRHGKRLDLNYLKITDNIEDVPHCQTCGHIQCGH